MRIRFSGEAPVAIATCLAVSLAALSGPVLARMGTRGITLMTVLLVVGTLLFTKARRVTLGLTTIVFVIGSSTVVALREPTFYARFGLLAALGVVALMSPPARKPIRALSQFAFFGLALSVLAMASAFWSADPFLTLRRGFSVMILFLVLYLLVTRVWTTRATIRGDLAIIASCLGVAIVLGLTPIARLFGSVEIAGRFRGMLENPNTIGIVATMLVPALIGLIVTATRRVERRWFVLLVFATVVSLILSRSRAGLIGTGVGTIAYIIGSRSLTRARKLLPMLGIAFAIIAVFLVSSAPRQDVQTTLARFSDRTGSGRAGAWQLSLELSAKRPIVGYGFGVSEDIFGPAVLNLKNGFLGTHVHNGYLQILLELGAAGLLLLLLLLSVVVRGAYHRTESDLHVALFACVPAGLTAMLAESGITSVGGLFAFLFWFLAAAAMRSKSLETESLAPESQLQPLVPTLR